MKSRRIEALIRGGHQHPEQILADLEAGSCVVLDPDEAGEYEAIMDEVENAGEGFTLEEYINFRCDRSYDAGFQRALDVANDRFRK
jgi:hypothetical protein